jgi:hypothetical protein
VTTNQTVREAVEARDAVRNVQRASDPGAALAQAAESGQLKMTPVLAAIGIDPSKPAHQAALLICNKYGLDPLLKHVVVVTGSGAYITRDGLLHVAHASGQFDGIEISAVGEDKTHWIATASVWRKDMSRPFTYPGRYPKASQNKAYGPEMAIKCAEVMALRRAFDVTGVPALDERHTDDDLTGAVQALADPDEPGAGEEEDDEPSDDPSPSPSTSPSTGA